MSNSPLVEYTRISPHKTSPRNSKIDTITIHCYVGQVTAKQGCDNFATTSRECSSNYVVGKDGSIGLSVEEKDRSWASGGKDKKGNPIRVNGISGADNDHRAITIEVASDSKHPYAVTDKAYNALIKLLADICQRNDIKELKWKADKSLVGKVDEQNMTVHRWFANKSCPGDWLYSRLGEIATKVNEILNSTKEVEVMYKVQVGKPVSTLEEAKALGEKVKKAGFDCYIVTESYTYVEVVEPAPAPTPEPAVIKVGSKVKVKDGAKSYSGQNIASFVYKRVYTVDELKGERAVLDKKGLCTAFHVKDLILQD